jgi:hypothetical protein
MSTGGAKLVVVNASSALRGYLTDGKDDSCGLGDLAWWKFHEKDPSESIGS